MGEPQPSPPAGPPGQAGAPMQAAVAVQASAPPTSTLAMPWRRRRTMLRTHTLMATPIRITGADCTLVEDGAAVGMGAGFTTKRLCPAIAAVSRHAFSATIATTALNQKM